MRKYAYAFIGGFDLGFFRIGGHGLGNLLFPWARATIAVRDNGLMPVAPTWPQLKPGHFIRGESDYRTYRNLFCATPNSINGLHKLWLLCSAVRESEFERYKSSHKRLFRSSIVKFTGMDRMFEPFLKEHVFLKEKLLEIVLPEHIKGLHGKHIRGIGLHVRRGDFCLASRAVPLSWYCDVVDALTIAIDDSIEFSVFSDGTPEELAPLLKKKNVSLFSFGSSIADLLALSCCRGLVGTAGSTFSMWASFLGRMPTIWPHKRVHKKGGLPHILYDNPKAEIEWMPKIQMQSDFVSQVRKNVKTN